MDSGKLAAEIAARNKAAREKSSDIAGRMANALSEERWKYFDGLIQDDGSVSFAEGDVEETSGSSGSDGAMDIGGGIQLDAGRDETPSSQ